MPTELPRSTAPRAKWPCPGCRSCIPHLRTAGYRHIVFPDHDVEVGEIEGEVLGFVAITDKWLHHLYVDPNAQRGGLGSALLRRAMAKRTTLNLWVFQQNVPARKFYKSHGFKEVELTDGQANEEKTPDVHMQWNRK